jgi:hypothetical protein
LVGKLTKTYIGSDSREKAFSFSGEPPVPFSNKGKESDFQKHSLKEWGVPVEDPDDSIFSLENLQEFESTDLQYLLSFSGGYTGLQSIFGGFPRTEGSLRPDNLSPVVSARMLPPTNHLEQRPTKRRRLDRDFLHNIIPHVRIIIFPIYFCSIS